MAEALDEAATARACQCPPIEGNNPVQRQVDVGYIGKIKIGGGETTYEV